MKNKFLFFVVLILSFDCFSYGDAVGDKEHKFLDTPTYTSPTDENGRPLKVCKDKNRMLDQAGCLQADGKISKYCSVIENFRPLPVDVQDPCGKEWVANYVCHDYAICVQKENANTNLKPSEKNKKTGSSR